MNLHRYAICLFLVSFTMSSCSANDSIIPIREYPFKVDEKRKSEIIKSYSSLEIGMNKAHVLDLFGKPNAIKNIYNPFQMDEQTGDSFIYVIRKDSNEGSELVKNEKNVRVFFDLNGSVVAAKAKGMDELKPLLKKKG